MRAKYALLLVPILAVATWLLMRGRGELADRLGTSSSQVDPQRIATTPVAPAADQPTASAPARPDRAPSPPVSAGRGAPPPARAPGAPAAADRPGVPPPAPAPAVPAPSADDAPAGKFNDKTGWGDQSVAKQLNREFMPLASECIDHAKSRKPFLSGLLSFTMVITPTGDGRAVVSALKVRPDNKIEDPEVWECIRESSFALEGLTAPHDFDISMPITRDDDPG